MLVFLPIDVLALTVSGIDSPPICPSKDNPNKCKSFFSSITLENTETKQIFVDNSLAPELKQVELGYIPKGSEIKINWQEYGDQSLHDHYHLRYKCSAEIFQLSTNDQDIHPNWNFQEKYWSIPGDFSWYNQKNPCYCKIWIASECKYVNGYSPTWGGANTRPFRICPIEIAPTVVTLDPDYSQIDNNRGIIKGYLSDIGKNEDRELYYKTKDVEVWFEYEYVDLLGKKHTGLALGEQSVLAQPGEFSAQIPEKIISNVVYRYRALASNRLSNKKVVWGEWKEFKIPHITNCKASQNVYFLGGSNEMPHTLYGFVPIVGNGFEKFSFYGSIKYGTYDRPANYSLKNELAIKNIDTVVLRYCCPGSHMTNQEMTDLEEWTKQGGKLIRYTGGCSECTWNGAMGEDPKFEFATQSAFVKGIKITENNNIVNSQADSSYHTNISKINLAERIEGNFKTYSHLHAFSNNWYGDLVTSFGEYLHGYRKYGKGVIIYNGLSMEVNGLITKPHPITNLIYTPIDPSNDNEKGVLTKIWQQELNQTWDRTGQESCALLYANQIGDNSNIQTLVGEIRGQNLVRIKGKVNQVDLSGKPFFAGQVTCFKDLVQEVDSKEELYQFGSELNAIWGEKGEFYLDIKTPNLGLREGNYRKCNIDYKAMYQGSVRAISGTIKTISITDFVVKLLPPKEITTNSAIFQAEIVLWGDRTAAYPIFRYWKKEDRMITANIKNVYVPVVLKPNTYFSQTSGPKLLPNTEYCFTAQDDKFIYYSYKEDEYLCFKTLSATTNGVGALINSNGLFVKDSTSTQGLPKYQIGDSFYTLYPKSSVKSSFCFSTSIGPMCAK